MKKCRVAIESESKCQNCCLFCDSDTRANCSEACPDTIENCPEQVDYMTDLQVIDDACPDAVKKITDLVVKINQMEDQVKVIRDQIRQAMETYNVKKLETSRLTMTYVAPTTRTTVDSAKLKKIHPDIYAECQKVSNVSATVKITVK